MSARRTVYHFVPTKNWLASRNPIKKSQILEWYKKESEILQSRKFKEVNRAVQLIASEVDRDTGEVVKKMAPEVYHIEKWKLSNQDYLVYKELLDKRFQTLKNVYNERIQNQRSQSRESPAADSPRT